MVCLFAVGFSLQSFTQEPLKANQTPKKKSAAINPKLEPFAEIAFENDTTDRPGGYITYNFGKIIEGPNVNHEFKFKNIGNSPLIISNAQTSCCMVASWPREPILSGGKSVISVTYCTQGRQGTFSKAVTVTSNSKTHPSLLLIVKGFAAN